jgi:hypothetical protein
MHGIPKMFKLMVEMIVDNTGSLIIKNNQEEDIEQQIKADYEQRIPEGVADYRAG